MKDGIYKIKKPKITSESPGQIDEIVPERDNEDNDKEPVKNHESPGENKNNDSFINELEILLTNVNPKTQEDDVRSVDEDSTPDPHINFEHINDINKCRPQTSYGGINQRKHRLQMALNGANGQPKTKIKLHGKKIVLFETKTAEEAYEILGNKVLEYKFIYVIICILDKSAQEGKFVIRA